MDGIIKHWHWFINGSSLPKKSRSYAVSMFLKCRFRRCRQRGYGASPIVQPDAVRVGRSIYPYDLVPANQETRLPDRVV